MKAEIEIEGEIEKTMRDRPLPRPIHY